KAQALTCFTEIQLLMLDELIEALGDRAEMQLENSPRSILEQSLQYGECLQLRWREPETRELIEILPCLVRILVPARCGVEDDGCMEMIFERGQRPKHCRSLALEACLELFERDARAPRGEDLVQLENAIELVHAALRSKGSRHEPELCVPSIALLGCAGNASGLHRLPDPHSSSARKLRRVRPGEHSKRACR